MNPLRPVQPFRIPLLNEIARMLDTKDLCESHHRMLLLSLSLTDMEMAGQQSTERLLQGAVITDSTVTCWSGDGLLTPIQLSLN